MMMYIMFVFYFVINVESLLTRRVLFVSRCHQSGQVLWSWSEMWCVPRFLLTYSLPASRLP